MALRRRLPFVRKHRRSKLVKQRTEAGNDAFFQRERLTLSCLFDRLGQQRNAIQMLVESLSDADLTNPD